MQNRSIVPAHANEEQARRKASLFSISKRDRGRALSPVTVMMAMPSPVMAMMPAPVTVAPAPAAGVVMPAAPVVMMMPAHFRGQLLSRILLHRRRSAGVDQRSSLCALERSRDQK